VIARIVAWGPFGHVLANALLYSFLANMMSKSLVRWGVAENSFWTWVPAILFSVVVFREGQMDRP
jgi:hypothetical protein